MNLSMEGDFNVDDDIDEDDGNAIISVLVVFVPCLSNSFFLAIWRQFV